MTSRILLSAVAIFACISLFSFINKESQEASSGFVVVKVLEPFAMSSTEMIISYGNGKTEKISLKTFKNTAENTDLVVAKLNALKKDGYKLKGMSGGEINTTYLLEKE